LLCGTAHPPSNPHPTQDLLGGGGTDGDMAARFARRAAELEAALERARETISQLETAHATDQKLTRSLRARVAKRAATAARARSSTRASNLAALRSRHERRGGSDFEYLRNVLLRFFLLPPEERGAARHPPLSFAASHRAR